MERKADECIFKNSKTFDKKIGCSSDNSAYLSAYLPINFQYEQVCSNL